jgi:hypothetical protein
LSLKLVQYKLSAESNANPTGPLIPETKGDTIPFVILEILLPLKFAQYKFSAESNAKK